MNLYEYLEDLKNENIGVDVEFNKTPIFGKLLNIIYNNESIYGIEVEKWGVININSILRINKHIKKR